MPTDAAWLIWLRQLHAHQAVAEVSKRVRLDSFAVAGRIAALWDRYDEQYKPLPVSDIDEFVCVPGFARALIETGWAIECIGGLEFPRFDDYQKEQETDREDTAARTARVRERKQQAEQALTIYKAYPRQVGRARAIMEIRLALAKGNVDYDTLLRKTEEFKESVAHLKTKEERKKIPLASTFYRQERWDDRPEDRPTAKTETDRPGRVESPEE